MHQISIQEAQTHISAVFTDVLKGEEVIVTDHERPVLKMIPLAPPAKPRLTFGSLKGKIFISDDFNETPEEFS